MRPDDFRRIALGMEGAVEGAHMGHPDFRVNARIFATIHPDQQFGMVNLTPEQQQQFIREHPATFAPESGAWGRAGCTSVRLNSVHEETLGEAMTLAWQNTIAKGQAKRSGRKRSIRPVRPSRKR
jgi:YjbR protein